MLIFTQPPGHTLTIHPHPRLDPATPVEQLFASGPVVIQVLGVKAEQAHLGVAAPSGLCIVREALGCGAGANPPGEGIHRVLARKLKVLMFLKLQSTRSLARAAGLAPATVRAMECGQGEVLLHDLESIAQALGVKVAELFIPPGQTLVERAMMKLLEGE